MLDAREQEGFLRSLMLRTTLSEEMTHFVQHFLGPKLEADGKGDLVILGYDQNREGLREWVDVMYKDEGSSKYYDGTACFEHRLKM